MAKGWTVSGVSDETRAAVSRVAQEAGMPVGAWIEQALRKALAEGLEAGVSIEEIEARVRKVVAQELQAVHQAISRLQAAAGNATRNAPPPVSLARERMRRRRMR